MSKDDSALLPRLRAIDGIVFRFQGQKGEEKPTICAEAADRIEALTEREAELQAQVERLREALEPSGYTKAVYMGEFSFNITEVDEDGEERQRKVYVPWTTIKEIMAAISTRATLGEPRND